LGLPREKTNVDGGAIAVGHPLAASGARITMHLLYELKRRGGRYGIGSACIRGGQGGAGLGEGMGNFNLSTQEGEHSQVHEGADGGGGAKGGREGARGIAERRGGERRRRKRKCVLCGAGEWDKNPLGAHPEGIGPACKDEGACQSRRAGR